jgi:electron transfer flavoprotein beta subunit
MKILVPIKRVPDPDTRIRIRPDGSGIETDGVKFSMNPFDAIALEEVLRLRERQGGVDEILVVSIGGPDCAEVLRAGLGMGADRALHIREDGALDSLAVARLLAAVFRREQPQLVLMGKQAIDDDANQAAQMLAGLLDIGQATFISRLTLSPGAARATCCRETDGGLETVSVTLPAVLSADLRLNEPRYVTALGIMKAKKKPLEETSAAALGVNAAPRARQLKLESAPPRQPGVRVRSVEEMLDRLRNEARVI